MKANVTRPVVIPGDKPGVVYKLAPGKNVPIPDEVQKHWMFEALVEVGQIVISTPRVTKPVQAPISPVLTPEVMEVDIPAPTKPIKIPPTATKKEPVIEETEVVVIETEPTVTEPAESEADKE